MITFAPYIREIKRGYSLYVRVTKNRTHKYIPMPYGLSKDDVSNGQITNLFVLQSVNKTIYDFNQKLYTLSFSELDDISLEKLVEFLTDTTSAQNGKGLNIFPYWKEKISLMKRNTGLTHQTAMSWLSKFNKDSRKSDPLNINSIDKGYLQDYIEWMDFNKMKDCAKRNALIKLQAIINMARNEFNDENHEVIRKNPFDFIRIPSTPKTNKGETKTLPVDVIRGIIQMKDTGIRQMDLARKMFIMSFACCGMNLVDFKNVKVRKGFLSYTRQKTSGKGGEQPFIKMMIQPEYKDVFDEFLKGGDAFSLPKTLSNTYVNNGLRLLSAHMADIYALRNNLTREEAIKELNLADFTFYCARHTWSSIAVNDCGVDITTVDRCLCHSSRTLTERSYIRKDYTFVDKTNREVIDYVFGNRDNE